MWKIWILGLALCITACSKEDIAEIRIRKESPFRFHIKEPCTIELKAGNDLVSREAVIKKRGGYSSKFAKPSFSVELDKKAEVAGLPRDDDWILNANYIDKTFMRHKISFDLFRDMGSYNLAAQCSYANVFLNEEYAGLYIVMQEVNAGFLNVNKLDTMGMVFKDPPVFRSERLAYVQEPGNYYQQKYPKITERDHTAYLETFIHFLFTASDQQFANEITKWIDLQNVMDWHILLLFSNNGDGMLKNFYLYKQSTSTPFRIAIWDYDHSFGRDGDNELNMLERVLDCKKVILLKRLMEIPETGYMQMLKKRWFRLRKENILSNKAFQKRMNRINRTLQPALNANFERWPVSSSDYYDANTYEEELEVMNLFVALRLKQLDAYFEAF